MCKLSAMRLDRLRSVRWPHLLAFVCVAVAVVIGLFLSLSGGDESVRDVDGLPYRSYAFEARMTSPDATGTAIIRGWYEAPSRTRWDIGPEGPEYDGWVRVQIVTEKSATFYEPSTHEFTTGASALATEFEGKPMPIMSNIAIGPLVSYFDPFRLTGSKQDEVLGRRVDVFVGPTTFYVDLQREFVLKQVFDGDGPMADVTIEVTKLTFDEDIPDSIWVFSPPATPPVTPTPTGGSRLFKPSYIPSGYTQTGVIKLTGAQITEGQSVNYAAGSDTLSIRQEFREGYGIRVPSGTPVASTRVEAYWKPAGSGGELGCIIRNVTVIITSTSLPRDELVRIAEGLR